MSARAFPREPGLARMVRALPSGPGVYRFRNSADAVLYVGRAAHLRSRVASYWSTLRDRSHLAPMVAAVARVEAVACASRHEAAWLERNLLQTWLAPWNRTPGGQETPVVIALDGRRGGPGLRVVHLSGASTDGVQLFGPYLGGLQVRRAVAGLHRIYPLVYAGTRLSAAERALADQRGISRRDRHVLVEALTAVLQRDPAAVRRARAELKEARQGAAAIEAFELAARVHAELRGLEWISSPQRVTVLSTDSCDVSGWSDGVLVSFGVRAGRLLEWASRRCDLASAAPLVAHTPDPWQDFAQRNADLAAALDRSRHDDPDGV